jgi:hypothetical protein
MLNSPATTRRARRPARSIPNQDWSAGATASTASGTILESHASESVGFRRPTLGPLTGLTKPLPALGLTLLVFRTLGVAAGVDSGHLALKVVPLEWVERVDLTPGYSLGLSPRALVSRDHF